MTAVIPAAVHFRGHRSNKKRMGTRANRGWRREARRERRADEYRMLSVVPLSSVPSRHQREVRGLVVMTAVVMVAGLGNKQEQR